MNRFLFLRIIWLLLLIGNLYAEKNTQKRDKSIEPQIEIGGISGTLGGNVRIKNIFVRTSITPLGNFLIGQWPLSLSGGLEFRTTNMLDIKTLINFTFLYSALDDTVNNYKYRKLRLGSGLMFGVDWNITNIVCLSLYIPVIGHVFKSYNIPSFFYEYYFDYIISTPIMTIALRF